MVDVQYAESTAESSTTSTSYQDKVTLTWTVPSQGDYVIIATADIREGSTSYNVKCQITIDGTAKNETIFRPRNTANRHPFSVVKRTNLSAASHTIKIQYCSSSASGTAYIYNARIYAFNLGTVEMAEDETRTTTTSTSYTDKLTLTFTPPSQKNYLIIANAIFDQANSGYIAYARLYLDGATVLGEGIIRPPNAVTRATFGVAVRVNLTAASHNLKIQYHTSNATYACGINWCHILAIPEDLFTQQEYGNDDSETGPAATGTWYDKVSLTFTAVAKDYMSLGSMATASKSTSYNVQSQLYPDATEKHRTQVVNHASDYDNFFQVCKVTETAGSKTHKLRYQAGTTSARVKYGRLYALLYPQSTAYQKEVTDAITLTENFSKIQTLNRTYSESVTLTENLTTKARPEKKTLTDSITLSETLTRTQSLFKTYSESISLSETMEKAKGKSKMLTESITLSDVLSKTRSIVRLYSESITLTEDLVAFKPVAVLYELVLAEALSLGDSYSRIIDIHRTLGETVVLLSILSPYAVVLRPIRYTTLDRVRRQTGLLTEDDMSDEELTQLITQAEVEVESWGKRQGVKISEWLLSVPSQLVTVVTYLASSIALTRRFMDARIPTSESRSGTSITIGDRGIKWYAEQALKSWESYLVSSGYRSSKSQKYGTKKRTVSSMFDEDEWRGTGEEKEHWDGS